MANTKIMQAALAAVVVVLVFVSVESALKGDECEVCIKFLKKVDAEITDEDRKDSEDVETKLRKICKKAKGKEHRFCYYVGGLEESATGILNQITKPMSYHMPAEKICEKLKKADSQICELKYDKTIDLSTANFKKLKVKDLKKVLDAWDETCKGCAEKSDFVKRIEELMPKYDPEAARKREEL